MPENCTKLYFLRAALSYFANECLTSVVECKFYNTDIKRKRFSHLTQLSIVGDIKSSIGKLGTIVQHTQYISGNESQSIYGNSPTDDFV